MMDRITRVNFIEGGIYAPVTRVAQKGLKIGVVVRDDEIEKMIQDMQEWLKQRKGYK